MAAGRAKPRKPKGGFDMLLDVRNLGRSRFLSLFGMFLLVLAGAAIVLGTPATPVGHESLPGGVGRPSASSQAAPNAPAQTGMPGAPGAAASVQTPQSGLSMVVLDPAHGGTDTGARGGGGIHESEIVLDFAGEVRRALEQQGFQVVLTRQTNDNPSFDDRSAIANAQRGAVFVTLHIASTGIPGTVRVYVNSDLPPTTNPNGLIPWDDAQAPFLGLSRKYGDLVQAMLAQRFKGSPETALAGAVRQLRTTAAPAIAVEVSSVVVNDRSELDHMAPAVADAIARGTSAFRPSYVIPNLSGALP